MRIRRNPWVYAILYTSLSLAIEASLIIFALQVVHLDDAKLWAAILTVPPVLAAWMCGYRRPKEFVYLVYLTSVLTFILTQVVMKTTGVYTGFTEPIIDRMISGLLAAEIAKRLAAETKEAG